MKMFFNWKIFAFVLMAFFVGAAICNNVEKCLRECPVTADYSPFCGTDNITYPTKGMLGCFQRCNKPISMAYDGKCKHDGTDPSVQLPPSKPTKTTSS